MRTPKTGRASIFRFKHKRVQGLLSTKGLRAFELQRRRLARIVRRESKDISDGDTIEFLARGEDETRYYLGKG